MSRPERNIEDLFRILFEQFTVNPTPGLWKKLQAKIAWKQFLNFSFNSFNVYFLVAGMTLAGAGAYYLLTHSDSADFDEIAEIVPAVDAGISIPVGDLVPVSRQAPMDEAVPLKTAESKPVIEDRVKPASLEGTQEKNSQEKADPIQQGAKPEKKTEAIVAAPDQPGSINSENNNTNEPIKVMVAFAASPTSGCSPLAVKFHNLADQAYDFNWTFGDGGNSNEQDPSYVFDEPGDFVVTLKIMGTDGKEYSRQQTIQVFETPRALFEFDEELDLGKNQPVNFYNYSRGADYFKWDFGDDRQSDLQEPIHFYEKPGSYHVKLKVWTDQQCYDSLVIFNAFTSQEQNIKVPNAFTPNLSGPSGGYYDVNNYDNTVFHPVIHGGLLEYQLKIFNRKGVLLFESNDFSIGWDGYYNEQLVKQDVYIWKIRGKFNNGKTFVESGDLTLIKQY